MAKKIGTVVPKLQLIHSGKSAVFHCFSDSIPIWYTADGSATTVYKNYNHTTLLLHSTDTTFSRTVTCLGTYENGSRFRAESELVVAGKLYR